jgi:exopolysaccharide biosynthesis protein
MSALPSTSDRRPSRGSTRAASFGLALLLATSGLTAAFSADGQPADAAPATNGLDLSGGDSTMLSADSTPLAPGLDLTNFRRLQPAGWVTGHVMTADLGTPTLSLDVVDSGTVSGGATVQDQIATTKAVAAVNGDYFDMNSSGAPVGTNVSSTSGLRSAGNSPREAFTMKRGIAAVQSLTATGSVTIGGAKVPIVAVNSPVVGADRIGYFTSAWGAHPLGRALGGPDALSPTIAAVTVRNGRVVAVSTDPAFVLGATAIPAGSGVLVGRELGATRLATLAVGDTVDVTVGTSADVDLAVGGAQRMIRDGKQTADDQVEAARTAVGVSRDGTHVSVVSIDGHAGDGRGMTIQELGRLMLDLGAYNAVNLDGGGSSTLVARLPGTTAPQLIDRPSDGTPRVVANALAFYSNAPAGHATTVAVAPQSKTPHSNSVFPGLSRTIAGTGLDQNLAGVAVDGAFATSGGVAVRRIDGTTARVTGIRTGGASVSFSASGKRSTTPITVLGSLMRLKTTSPVVALSDQVPSAVVTITGFDAEGFGSPIETSDITVSSGAAVTVAPAGPDSYTITPTVASGSSTVSFAARGISVDMAVTVGSKVVSVADFADGARWTTASDRATGTTVVGAGPHADSALTLDYDFSTSTGTRGYYAVAPEMSTAGSLGRPIGGQPQALTLWVDGDAKGTWPRLQLKDGAGTTINLDGAFIDWAGWKQVRFPVPPGTPYPLSFQRVRLLETKPTASYSGHVSIAGLEAIVAPDVAQPVAAVVPDPAIVANGTVSHRAQRIAVMSDAQFVARQPDSAIVAAVRTTLRQIVAAKPDYLVIDGDFVDEGSAADIAFARKILDEEIGTALPYTYVPGNHEIMGGPISNFTDVFGPSSTSRTLGQTKIITLDSSAGSFRGSGLAQLRMLDTELASAAADRNITGVVVFNHHPADDPLPDKTSQLGDRYEAAQFTATLAQFRADSGKSIAAVNGHVGAFHATSTDGVSQIVNGNSGKSPAGTTSTGGFTGWTLLGIDPAAGVLGATRTPGDDRTDWLQAETKPRVDSLVIDAPATLAVGQTATVTATVNQDGIRKVPVAWPVSARWSGRALAVDGDGTGDRRTDVARFSPTTGQITGLRPGTGSIVVSVNGVTTRVNLTVSRR